MAQRGIKAKIDLAELEKLCAMQATDEEIGAFFGVSGRTILRRKKVKKFAEVMERGRAKGRLSMRRLQMKLLEAGNATMGVWLGKQYLEQTDYVEHRGELSLTALVGIPRATLPAIADRSLGHEFRQINKREENGATVGVGEAQGFRSSPDDDSACRLSVSKKGE